MKTNSCSECEQPLIKSIEGIPLYYSFTNNQNINNQNINNQNITPTTSSFGSSIQSPSNKNIKYDEYCAKYNLIAFGLFLLIIIICLIIYESRN